MSRLSQFLLLNEMVLARIKYSQPEENIRVGQRDQNINQAPAYDRHFEQAGLTHYSDAIQLEFNKFNSESAKPETPSADS